MRIEFACFLLIAYFQVHTVVVTAEWPHGMGRACLSNDVSHQHEQVCCLLRHPFFHFSALTAMLSLQAHLFAQACVSALPLLQRTGPERGATR